MKKLLCVLVAMLLLFAFAACEAETEPVRTENQPKPAPVVNEEVTEAVFEDGDTVIISVAVYHGDGEVSDNRMSAIKGKTLAETLLERTFITEDFGTVDGERIADDATWTLYVNGVYTSDSWDTVLIDNGFEYMFEYTTEIDVDVEVDEFEENEEVIEEVIDEEIIDPDA